VIFSITLSDGSDRKFRSAQWYSSPWRRAPGVCNLDACSVGVWMDLQRITVPVDWTCANSRQHRGAVTRSNFNNAVQVSVIFTGDFCCPARNNRNHWLAEPGA